MPSFHSPRTRKRSWLHAVIVCVACIVMSSCGKTIKWKQEVQLHDGRVIVVDRVSKQTGKIFPENVVLEKKQELSFIHPVTHVRITWQIPMGLLPYTLDAHQNEFYYVLTPYTVADYNSWGCPNPPYLVYQYTDGKWIEIPVGKLPAEIVRSNLCSGQVVLATVF